MLSLFRVTVKSLGNWHIYQMPQRKQVWLHESICTAPGVSWSGLYLITTKVGQTDHTEHSSWFVYSESLDHLEHIHHSLCLTAVNGGSYGTEHPTATHCVTTGGCINTNLYVHGILREAHTCSEPVLGCFQFSFELWPPPQWHQWAPSGWSRCHQETSWSHGTESHCETAESKKRKSMVAIKIISVYNH